jgi:putative membrane protein
MTTQTDKDPHDLPDATRLAVDRTRLAHERTLMAWIRTATSMIGFGFTLYKFFAFLKEKGETRPVHRLLGPREFAFLMILIGLVTLVLATVQHRGELQAMRARYGPSPPSMATVVAALVSILGIVGLLAVILRQ